MQKGDDKIYIFDFDGTIVNLNADWKALKEHIFNNYCELLLQYGINQSSNLGLMVQSIVKDIGWVGRNQLSKLILQYEQRMSVPSYSQISKTINFIKQLNEFYIISNNSHNTIEKVLVELGMLGKCKQIVGFEDVLYSKPNNDPYETLINKTNISSKKSIIYVGDRESDEKFARNINVNFCWVGELNL